MAKRYVIVDIERDDEAFACSFVDTCNTLEEARSIMQAEFYQLCKRWPDNSTEVEQDSMLVRNNDCWDFTACHKLIIMDTEDKRKKVWF